MQTLWQDLRCVEWLRQILAADFGACPCREPVGNLSHKYVYVQQAPSPTPAGAVQKISVYLI